MGSFDEDFAGYVRPSASKSTEPEVSGFDQDFADYVRGAKKKEQDAAPTIGDQVERQLGLTARDLAEGHPYVSIPLAIGDVANKGINYVTSGINNVAGTNIPPLTMPSQEYSNALTDIGLPQPSGSLERVVNNTAKGVVGAAGGISAGNALASSANPVISGAGETLASNPLAQTIGTASGAAASSIAQENGASPLTQFAAGIGGSLVPGAVVGGVNAVSNLLPKSQPRPEIAQLAYNAAKNYKIDIPAAQISNNPFVKWLDAALPSVPFSGHGGEMENAKSQFTRAVSNTFGADSPSLTKDVMNEARDNISTKFNDIAKATPAINISDNILNKLTQTQVDAAEVLGKDGVKISKQIDKILDLSKDGALSGESWQALMRTNTPLDRLAKSSDPNISYYARNIKDALYDGLNESASPELIDKLSNAKMQWKNYKTVQDLADKSGVTGEISPALLLSKTNQAAKKFGSNGLNDLQELGDIGQQFFKGMPSSGTAERNNIYKILGGLGTIGTTIISGHPEAAAMEALTGAATLGGGKLASMYLNNPVYRNKLMQSAAQQQIMPPSSYVIPAATTALNNKLRGGN